MGSVDRVALRIVVFIRALDGGDGPSPATALAAGGGEIVELRGLLTLAVFDAATRFLQTCRPLVGKVRAGVSCGDVEFRNGSVHGLPAVEASRLLDLAEPGQILCAHRVARLPGSPPLGALDVRTRGLKGLGEAFPFFALPAHPSPGDAAHE